MIDTNDLAEGLEGLVPFLVVAGLILMGVLVVAGRLVGAAFVRLLKNRQARKIVLGLAGLFVLAVSGFFVFATLASGLGAWLVLGGVVLVGAPLGVLLMALLDDSADDTPDTIEGMNDVPSIWR